MNTCNYNLIKEPLQKRLFDLFKSSTSSGTNTILNWVKNVKIYEIPTGKKNDLNSTLLLPFTRVNKLKLLGDVLQSLEFKNLNPEEQERFKILIDEARHYLNTKHAISTPSKINLFQKEEKTQQGKLKNSIFEINIFRASAFVGGISGDLSLKLVKEITGEINDAIINNRQSNTIVINSESLNESLLNYKQKLLDDLFNKISYYYPDLKVVDLLISPAGTYENYKALMKAAANYLIDLIEHAGGVYTLNLDENLRNTFFNPLKLFILLLYFDDLVEQMSSGTVVVKGDTRNNFMYTEPDKYKLKKDTIYEASFADDYLAANGEHSTPALLKFAFEQIKLTDSGEHLGGHDLRKLIQEINNLYLNLDVVDSDLQTHLNTLFESSDSYKLWDALSKILQHKELQTRIGVNKCQAIEEYFTDYLKRLNNTLKNIIDVDSIKDLHKDKNIVDLLITSILNQYPAIFVATSENGNKINTSIDRQLSKKAIFDVVRNRAKENYNSGKDYIYKSTWQINPGKSVEQISDVISKSAQKNLRAITGLDFSPFLIEKLLEGNNLATLGSFLSEIQYAYNTYLSNPDLTSDALDNALNNFINYLQYLVGSIKFTDLLVEDLSSEIKQIYDQDGNPLPSENMHSILAAFEQNKSEFAKHWKLVTGKVAPEKNILFSRNTLTKKRPFSIGNKGKFIGHTAFRSDINIKDKQGNTVLTSHVLLEPEEQFAVAIGYDWFSSILDGDQMFLQTETYSDKPRVILHAYNFAASLNGHDSFYNENFYNPEDLLSMWVAQTLEYYETIEQDICQKWNKLTLQNFNSFQDIITWLNENEFKQTNLKVAILNLQQNGDTTNFILEYDYIINNDGTISLNNSLVLKVARSKDANKLRQDYNEGFESYKNNLKSSKTPIPIIGFEVFKNWSDSDWENPYNKELIDKALRITGLKTVNGLRNFIKLKTWVGADGTISSEAKQILKMYYATRQLLTDAEIQIGIKQPWLHTPKKKSNLRYDLLLLILHGGGDNYDKLVKEIKTKDLSPRLVAGKKRNSSGVTTAITMKLGLRFGVPEKMKVIMAAFPKEAVTNHLGISDQLKPHDGASFTEAIFSEFEEASYPGHDFRGTRKTIGLMSTFGSFTQVKHAENTLTNELLRGMSEGVDVENEFHPDNLKRNTLECCKLNKRFLYNWKKNKSTYAIEAKEVIYDFNGRLALLTNIDINDNNYIKFTWKYLDGNQEEVPANFIVDLVNGLYKSNSVVSNLGDGYLNITNLYLLWNAFGGIYSKTTNEFGNIVDSEISNELCAKLISWYDVSPDLFADLATIENEVPMKEQMVAKIIDPESCKSGQIAINNAIDLTQNKCTWGWIDTSKWGVQQDYTHESLDSKIPALTQVITAIAFNGNNIELVDNLYNTLGDLIAKSLKPILNKTKNLRALNIYLAKKLEKSLQKNAVASSATDIVMLFLEDVKNDPENPGVFCFSHKDIFYKVTSDLVASLNRDTIKQEFDGIAVIQCPSQGIVMLYEDHNGNFYTKLDIIRMAKNSEKVKDWLASSLELQKEDTIINYYFNNSSEGKSKFSNIDLTPENLDVLNIGDHCFDSSGNEIIIKDPSILTNIINDIKLGIGQYQKIYTKLRDLAVTKITWTELDGTKNNLFALNSTQELIEALKNKATLKNLDLIKKWHRANLEGIANKNQPYYYNSLEDYKFKIPTFISDVKHKAGLQVIPKKYSKFKEEDKTLAYIRDLGPNYFRNIVEGKYKLSNSENPNLPRLKDGECAITLDNSEIIFTKDALPDSETALDIIYDEALNKTFITDVYGNRLLEMPNFKNKNLYKNKANFPYKAYLSNYGGKSVLTIHTTGDKFDDIVERTRKLLKENGLLNAFYFGNGKRDVLDMKRSHSLYGQSLEENINRLAKLMYTSWEASHLTISARIPSQSFQSFLYTETVAYTENTDYNLGYMNIWEMWFQGSKQNRKLEPLKIW